MGFFSSLLSTVGQVVGTVFGGSPAVQAPPQVVQAFPAAQAIQPIISQANPIAASLVPVASAALSSALTAVGGTPTAQATAQMGGNAQLTQNLIDAGGFNRGNGRTFRRTFVQTVDLFTGAILRHDAFPGAPFLMNNQVRQLRTTAKKLTRAAGKIPTRRTRTSLTTQLKDAVLQRALASAKGVGALCPPKC